MQLLIGQQRYLWLLHKYYESNKCELSCQSECECAQHCAKHTLHNYGSTHSIFHVRKESIDGVNVCYIFINIRLYMEELSVCFNPMSTVNTSWITLESSILIILMHRIRLFCLVVLLVKRTGTLATSLHLLRAYSSSHSCERL